MFLRMFLFGLQEIPEFDLHFEKCYKWTASRVADKEDFIETLFSVCNLTIFLSKISLNFVVGYSIDIYIYAFVLFRRFFKRMREYELKIPIYLYSCQRDTLPGKNLHLSM